MKDSLVYNIPAKLIDAYRDRNVILRSSFPTELVHCLGRADPAMIRFLQLLSTTVETDGLESAGTGMPLEIVLKDPDIQFQHLYKLVSLLDSHPVRIAIPVIPGFSTAVKLAVSLGYEVRLQLDQPDELLIREVEKVLDLYLHGSTVRQPIEFFQSLLLSYYRNEPVSLWEIAEEDPTMVRYVTDDGEETISRRFAGVKLVGPLDEFVGRYGQALIDERRECHDCEFFNRCGGYFKWPDKTYRCDGVKRVFRALADAAHEVKHDLEAFEGLGVRVQP